MNVERTTGTHISRNSLTWQGAEIPSLYGIRGVAALMVVLGHAGLAAANAIYAVICFFVLSGFLITHLLLREVDKTGDISLRRFYLRRTLRIFPAFYVYAACYIVARMLLGIPIDWLILASCLTYTNNYFIAFSHHPWQTMVHAWSLAVEEQFYLLWPFLVWRFRYNRPALLKGLIGAIIFIWAYRWIAVQFNAPVLYIFASFETRSDALAIGCLIAVANREHRIPRWMISPKWPGLVAALVICVSSTVQLDGPQFAWSLVAVACAALIIQSVAHCRSIWYRWLGSRPLHALGVISYSLYLYHPFALHLPASLRHLPLEVAFAIAMAIASYFVVEKPFLRIKDHLFLTPEPAAPNPSVLPAVKIRSKIVIQ